MTMLSFQAGIASGEDLIISFIDALIIRPLFFLILYRTAYKKYGTRFLTLCLAIGFFKMFAIALVALNTMDDIWIFGALLVDVSLYGWWWILSLKLRKMNKIIRRQQQFVSAA